MILVSPAHRHLPGILWAAIALTVVALTPASGRVPAASVPPVTVTPPQQASIATPATSTPSSPKLTLNTIKRVGDHYEAHAGPNHRAILTLKPNLQRAAHKVLKRAKARAGAVVVMDMEGRVLAFAGSRLQKGSQQTDYALPTSVWAPAASVFKLVTAAALLDAGVGPKRKVCYHGGLRSVVRSNLADSPARDNRCANFSKALARSQNAVFAKLVHRHLSPTRLATFAQALGFDSAPEFAVPCEANRFDLPTEPLAFARAAAGFWHSELSPLGGASLATTIATGGINRRPHIVEAYVTNAGTRHPVSVEPGTRVLKSRIARTMSRMMVATTTTGSGRKGFRDRRGRPYLRDIRVAGKTGTLSRKAPHYTQYSWFVGFAPADRPQYAVAVILGNAELWHIKAHTGARMVLQRAFDIAPPKRTKRKRRRAKPRRSQRRKRA